MSAADDRITKALGFALQYGGIDGDHHKTWVIDPEIVHRMAVEELQQIIVST